MPRTRFMKMMVLSVMVLLCRPAGGAADPAALHDQLAALRQSYRAGQYPATARRASVLASLGKERKDLRIAADAFYLAAASYQAMGRLEMAQTYYQQGFDASSQAQDNALVLKGYTSLGHICLLLGALQPAQDTVEKGLALARRLNDEAAMAGLLNIKGGIHEERRELGKALSAYQASTRAAEAGDRPQLAVKGLMKSAQLYVKSASDADVQTAILPAHTRGLVIADDSQPHEDVRDLSTGIATLTTAVEKLAHIDASADKGYMLIALSGLAHAVCKKKPVAPGVRAAMLKLAFETLAQSHAIAQRLDNPGLASHSLGRLGGIYETAGRLDDALIITSQALLAAQQAGAHELLFRWEWQTGRLLKAKGETVRAIAAFRRAIFHLDLFKEDLIADCRRHPALSFREQVGPVYFELADALLKQSAHHDDPARKQDDLRAARATVEELKHIELQDLFQDECISDFQKSITDIDQQLETAAVVYPIILGDRLEILVTLSDGLKQFISPVDVELFNKTVRRFRSAIEHPGGGNYLAIGRELYDWILRPLEKELAAHDVHTLIFVPDGPLRTIPMGALYDGEQFLINRFAVVVSPGIQLTDLTPLQTDNVHMLFAGMTQSVRGAAALPGVKDELAAIRSLFDCDVLMDETFSLGNFEQKLQAVPYSVVHIASHGQFDRDPEKNYLLAFDDNLTIARLEELMALGRLRKMPVELLTLSACQTAAGDDLAALGLAGVALKAGARSALASLWFVDDRATAAMSADFYRILKTGRHTKAEALQQAQVNLKDQADFRHPAYWAPFLLIGNWL